MPSQFKQLLPVIFLMLSSIAVSVCHAQEASFSLFETEQNWQEKSRIATALLADEKLPKSQKIAIYQQLADTAFGSSDFSNGLKYFKLLEQNTTLDSLPKEHFRAMKMQGVCYYYQGLMQRAAVEYGRALNLAKKMNNKIEQANLLSNIGLAYFKMHNMELALDFYQRAKDIYELEGSAQDKADILHNIAGVYIRLSRYDLALDMYRQVLKVFQKLGNEAAIAQVYGNMGVAYSESKQYPLSLHYYQLALRFYQSQKDQLALSRTNTNLANINLVLGKLKVAKFHARAGRDYAVQADNKSLLLAALHVLGKVQLALGDITQAQANLMQSESLAKEYKDELRIKDGLGVQALLSASLGDYKLAIALHNEFIDHQRSITSEEVLQALNAFQSQFEASKLNQEIKELKQAHNLQNLEATKQAQLTIMLTIVLMLVVITVVALYRRSMEKKAKFQLAEKVQQRTEELQTIAQELRQANQVKSQFLANISHEIRTPLTAILGQTDHLIQGLYPPEQLQDELIVIQKNSEHLKDLINDVLDLSKIEADKLELHLTEFDLSHLLLDIFAMFKPQAKSKQLQLLLDNQLGASFWVKLDYMRVKQILINLCANAIKFTTKGSVTIELLPTNQGVQFNVIDTGMGMDEEQIKVVFDCFIQADNSITRRFGGTGLGLSLSQQLAMMMGGYISVESESEQGSQFGFYLPCKEQQPNTSQTALEQSGTLAKLQGRVLLAEDHPDNLRLIARYLRSLGLDVISCENGEQAVELCLKEFPDVVLLDIQMPVMDGMSALNLLKECGFNAPIYALTANAMSHEIQGYLDAGFSGYLSKPIDKFAFYNALASHCTMSQDVFDAPKIDMSDLASRFTQSFNDEAKLIKCHIKSVDLVALKHDSHRLLGAAQMFGLDELAQCALALDNLLSSSGDTDSEEIKQAVDSLLVALGSEPINA